MYGGALRGAAANQARDVVVTTVTVVIPAKNEAANIPWVLGQLPDFVDEVILVDGLSVDGTVAAARAAYPNLVVVEETRPGKGAALRAGFDAAKGDAIVMLDADGSMAPHEIRSLIRALEAGFDFAKGSRFTEGGSSDDITLIRRTGHSMLLFLVNRLFGAKFTDLCYGLCAFRRDCLPRLGLLSDGFEIETEMVLSALTGGLAIAEIPSLELPRRTGQSNLRTFRDGFRVLRMVMTQQRHRPRSASPSSPGAEIVALREEPLETGAPELELTKRPAV